MKTLTEWGLSNPHLETWAFGKGWSLVRFTAHMIEPQVQPMIGLPGAWTPGTNGTVTAEVVRVEDRERSRLRDVPRQAAGQDRADAAGACRAHARRTDRAAHDRQGLRGGGDGAGRGARDAAVAARRGGARRTRRAVTCRRTQRVLQDRRRRRAASIAGATPTRRPAAAICRGTRSAPTAARSFRPAAARAASTPAPGCRRSRSRSSTTTAWSASSRRACR